MKTIDLHTHSTVSDGADAPREVVRRAAAAGLCAVALTDHDAVDGVKEALAAGREYGIEVIPGVELSAQYDTELHILGYFIDPAHPRLADALAEARRVRYLRQEETCEKLQEQGLPVTMEEVRQEAGGDILCRAHFARLLVKKGIVPSVAEAFRHYLSVGCYAYSNKQALTPADAVSVIREAGGIPSIAHLHLTKQDDAAVRALLRSLIPHGLQAIEGYYTEYTPEMGEKYRRMAAELGLALTGGSDYHGAGKPHIAIGKGTGDLAVPAEILSELKRIRAHGEAAL